MKLYRLIFPCLLAMSVTSCSLTLDTVNSISFEIKEKARSVGDYFDLDDITAYLHYTVRGEKEIGSNKFAESNISVSYVDPSGVKTNVNNDFLLESAGNYTLELSYNPLSKYHLQCSNTESFTVDIKNIKAESLSLDADSYSISKGSSQLIGYTILPNDVTNDTPSFTSNDKDIAIVSEDGLITGVEEGQCIISVQADDIKKDCLVTVTPSNTVDYIFASTKFETPIGDWDYDIEGSSIDTRLNRGVSVLEETHLKSQTAFNQISNIQLDYYCSGNTMPFGSIISNYGTIEVLVNETVVETAQCRTANTSISDSINIDTEMSGEISLIIKPNESEDCRIYLRSISITYSQDDIYPTSIELKGKSSIGIGENDKLTISYTPSNANIRLISWKSSNNEILSVGKDGTIYGQKEGVATVVATAQSVSGTISSSFDVQVKKIPVESVDLIEDRIELFVGKSKKIDVSVSPINASNKLVVFESSNPNIATVDSSGNVTGISIGECTITCRSDDDQTKVANCKISILKQPDLVSKSMDYTTNDYTELNYYEIDSTPSIGKTKLLVIPVWFTDSSSYITNKDNVRSDIEKVYFGTNEQTGWRSIKTYYEEESNGKLEITGTVSEWFECGNSMQTYNYSSSSSSTKTTDLVKKAVDWYFSKHPSDSRKNYDCDENGYLDGVILIYGCPDYSAFNTYASRFLRTTYGDNLWAYTFWLQNSSLKSTINPGPNSFFWASYDFMYSAGTFANNRTGKSNYGSGITSQTSVDSHTFIHEMGHLFGLEDYYDYSNYYKPGGGFSMQDFNVGGHDPFSCLALGWAEAFVPIENCTIKLNPFQSSKQVILLSPSFNSHNSPFDEYLLLELYTPTGLNEFDTKYTYGSNPSGVKSTGIRLWHVDARLIKYSINGVALGNGVYNYPVVNCKYMMSNTYYSSSTSTYISPLGRGYSDYNILQLIRNNTASTYHPTDYLKESSLFKNGSRFDMQTYRRQFVNSGKLNSGASLGWEFEVSLSGSGEKAVATITLKKD